MERECLPVKGAKDTPPATPRRNFFAQGLDRGGKRVYTVFND